MTPATVHSHKPTVVYDGECPFCIARIESIRKLDTGHEFDYIPRQNPESEERFPQIRTLDLEEGLLLVEPDGRVFVAADALYHIARRLPGTRGIAWLYKLPIINQATKIGYRIVALNRKRLGQTCDRRTCKLP